MGQSSIKTLSANHVVQCVLMDSSKTVLISSEYEPVVMLFAPRHCSRYNITSYFKQFSCKTKHH